MYNSVPDNDFEELTVVYLSKSNILTNLRTEAKVGNSLVLTVDMTEAGNLLRGSQLYNWKNNKPYGPYAMSF